MVFNVDEIGSFFRMECVPKPTFSREKNQCLITKQQMFDRLYCWGTNAAGGVSEMKWLFLIELIIQDHWRV
jgi:hypothetical protein